MRIETEVKLDFKDVLIRPKRSALSTRSNVDISREFRFRHTQADYNGVPIIAANMDTTGTFEMARALDAFGLSIALHKHYPVEELVAFFKGWSESPPLSTRWASARPTRRSSSA